MERERAASDESRQVRPVFVGREHELAELMTMLRSCKLISIVGAPGVGKTRLVSETLAEMNLLNRTSTEPGGSGFGECVVVDHHHYRSDRLPAEVAGLVADRSQVGADGPVVVTCREPLELDGETVLLLGPLALPSADVPAAAGQLFEACRGGDDGGHRGHDDDAETVLNVCRQLDGVPLSIEIAATRARQMSVAEMLGRDLSREERATQRRRRRRRSVAEVIAWTMGLLTPREREHAVALAATPDRVVTASEATRPLEAAGLLRPALGAPSAMGLAMPDTVRSMLGGVVPLFDSVQLRPGSDRRNQPVGRYSTAHSGEPDRGGMDLSGSDRRRLVLHLAELEAAVVAADEAGDAAAAGRARQALDAGVDAFIAALGLRSHRPRT